MQTGQTNTGSNGPKEGSPMGGFFTGEKTVGALGISVEHIQGLAPFVKVRLMSLSTRLDRNDLRVLREALDRAEVEMIRRIGR